jgi:hypothetical protein
MKKLLFIVLTLVTVPAWSDCVFREDTASQTFLVGPFLDGTDGITAETGLTVANTDIRISKNGANTVAKNSGGCGHDESGMYQCTFDATDTDTAGRLQIYTDNNIGTSIVPVFHECTVLAAEYYDLLDGTTSIMTSRQAGNPLLTTIDGVTTQTSISLAAGPSNNDALNNMTFYAVGGTEECERQITDYVGTGADVTLESACPFTLATSDTVYIFNGNAGHAVQVAQDDLDIITGSAGAVIDSDAITASTIAADAIGASELADSATAEIWAVSCEDQGGGYSCREAMSVILSEAVGTCVYTSDTRTWVCKDPSGTETRFTLVYGTDLDGDRDTSTPTPMTP